MRACPRLAGLFGALALAGCGNPTELAYRDYSERLIEAGLMREDRAPADAPFTDADLARNFVRIALAVEDFGSQKAGVRPLRRWEGPVRYKTYADDAADRAAVDDMMRRISALTGLAARPVEEDPNFLILFVARDTRLSLARFLDGREGPGAAAMAESLRVADDVSPCLARAGGEGDSVIKAAFVIIKGETRGRLRRSCIEEELVQSMGLTNDHPEVRPSIFNDDEEFAYMTTHDELLLRMLYHPRLRPGMREAEVRPLLPGVIRDVRRDAGL